MTKTNIRIVNAVFDRLPTDKDLEVVIRMPTRYLTVEEMNNISSLNIPNQFYLAHIDFENYDFEESELILYTVDSLQSALEIINKSIPFMDYALN